MVGSLNRGLWLSLGVGAVYAALRLAVRGRENQRWWQEILAKLTGPPHCNAVASLQA